MSSTRNSTFTPHTIRVFTLNEARSGKPNVALLHTALGKLKLPVSPEEVKKRELGESTVAAIKTFQEKTGLAPSGEITPETFVKLKVELEHRYYADNKTRTARVQDMLTRVGLKIDPEEIKRRVYGPTTEKALKQFQESSRTDADGQLTEVIVDRLNENAVRARFTTKTQVGQLQRSVRRAARIGKIEVAIDPDELKKKELGPSTRNAIKAFQAKYGLNPSGEIDAATHARLQSVVAGRPAPVKTLKAQSPQNLKPLRRNLRINMVSDEVGKLQQTLAYLGHKIDETEFKTKTFGKSTRKAVIAYQRSRNLPQTGHMEGKALYMINAAVESANPQVTATGHAFRVRGTFRDAVWAGQAGVKVQVWEKALRGEGTLLAERRSQGNGFFDVPYDAPRNAGDGQVKSPFHIQIKFLDNGNQELGSRIIFNPTQIAWANFTQGNQPYRGTSLYEVRMKAISGVIGGVVVRELEESQAREDITHVALNAGLSQDDVMRVVLAHRAAADLAEAAVGPAVFFAFIQQNLPPNLPADPLHATDDWAFIDQIVDMAVNGVAFMDPGLQALALETAMRDNLIPIAVGQQKDVILDTLKTVRERFALEKPILAGNGNVESLLNTANVDAQKHSEYAKAFLDHGGFGEDFWDDLISRPADFGGVPAIQEFRSAVDLGQIAKSHLPTMQFLKAKIDDPLEVAINAPRDLAKLAHADWVGLIQANGGVVPAETDGNTPQEKINVFAGTLAQQSERLFPTVALAAEVNRSNNHGLQKVPQVQQLIDTLDLNMRTTNVDKAVADAGINVDAEVLGEARVVQRVQRLAPTAPAGRALLDEKIHHSPDILRMGKEQFTSKMEARNVDRRTALTMYGQAEFKYAHVLMRIGDYRHELHRNDPAVIVKHTYTVQEQQQLLGDIPDLETLFGALDFCDCKHCQSVYGPAAYLADLLRFLESHPSEEALKNVRDILFRRRPDIGNIKLNCENTDTLVPYIDLVCEVLESAVPAPNPDPNFSFQTTRTKEELRTFPENVRRPAYDKLKDANFPIDGAFNLWQEQARAFLAHLGVKRYELMETFQKRPQAGPFVPTDASIAGEFFGMSTHDVALITTPDATQAKQDEIWGFDTTRAKVGLTEFLPHANIEYTDLLSLLQVQWNAVNALQIERPPNTCGLDSQNLANLTLGKFDQMHRFFRLWRKTDLKMWEADRLIRAPRVGNGNLDNPALVAMKEFKQVQDRLGLPFDGVLSFYAGINTETRFKPEDITRAIEPLYTRLFQNRAVIDPVDADFEPLTGLVNLADHKPTLLAAFALRDEDLDLVLPRTDGKMTLANLSLLFNIVSLSRAIKVPFEDMLLLLDLVSAEIPDVFASPRRTLDFLDYYDWIRTSRFTVQELDFLLNHRADSPFALRDEVITQYIEAQRESLRTNTATPNAAITSSVAAAVILSNDQAFALLDTLTLNGQTLLQRLNNPALVAKDANDQYVTPITDANFPNIFGSYRLLHKASMLVQRYKIANVEDLDWLLTKANVYSGLDFNALPVSAPPGASLFTPWLNLTKWIYIQGQFPEPEDVSVSSILDDAANNATDLDNDVRAGVIELTQWSLDDLKLLDTGTKAGYTDMETWVDLLKQMKQIKRLGIDAARALEWSGRDDDAKQFQTAQEVRETAKSKYDYDTWLSKARPMQDDLREKKRTALAGYLVEKSLRAEPESINFGGNQFRNPKHWRDINDLFGYFLIDVQMSACQGSTRIKQAISSVQMFVQRAMLNLEQPYVQVSREEREDSVSLNSWKQWQWMRSYRIWEANRKVFLYPENWIYPELRDDKSPFFKQLEDEILQKEITEANCEEAFTQYVERVLEVSHLEIAGVYHEYDDDNPNDNLPPNINILHVIGRTKSEPAQNYYRQFDLNYNNWTAWEKIDLDITGDHVVPVVFNRKLHLFWLLITDKAQKVKKQPPAKASDAPQNVPEGPKMMEIRLAWTIRKDGGWTSKKTAPQVLIHPWERPHDSYNLKPRYKSRENLLWLDLYISTSQAFNNTKFYDPYKAATAYVTATRYSETGRPWHASSFVFDGRNVVDLKLKQLKGQYHVLDGSGYASDDLINTNSHKYVHDNFGKAGLKLESLNGKYEIAPRLTLPDGMRFENTSITSSSGNANKMNVLESEATRTLLNAAQRPFQVTFSQHHIQFDTAKWENSPFFYQDRARAFFVKPEWRSVMAGYNQTVQQLRYNFYPFYHPYAPLFLRELGRSGIPGLLNRRIQRFPKTFYPGNGFAFAQYGPTAVSAPDETAQSDIVDFSREGAYSIYNWEIFFHAPLLIACKLAQNQRFEESIKWFHYIFDPTSTDALATPQRYWITKPFFDQNSDDYRKQRIEAILQNIDQNVDQVQAWKNNPFKPHLIARYRPVAYQKTVVMKYIDTLFMWADQLYRRDTMETINEATLLYVLAYELLGRKPAKVPNVGRNDRSYNELVADGALDVFGNKRVDVLMETFTGQPKIVIRTNEGTEPLPFMDVLYFGIPANDKFPGYWQKIEERLFNIRHCRNIQGIFRVLEPFEPAIDPDILVKAAAAGIDLNSLQPGPVGGMAPNYRYRLLSAKAIEFCNDVRAFGEKLLSVLERRDGEALALLRSSNEIEMLNAVKSVRKQQVKEANETWSGLEAGVAVIDKRLDYYSGVPRMNEWEIAGTIAHGLGIVSEVVATILNTVAGTAHLFPQITAGASGFGGSPQLVVNIGGDNVGKSSANYAALFQGLASILHQGGQMLDTQGGYTRRDNENTFQKDVATLEKTQMLRQVEAARLRFLIAQTEADNHDLQIEETQSVDSYMHDKYTDQQLYDWMLSQLATVYFQSYQLAYDMARRAEQGFQFELGRPEASFIQFGYWDSLKKGLMSAEKLSNDIRRMEAAYYDLNARELEITKNISLAEIAPLELLKLKQSGTCTVTLPEWLFDLDFPGQCRRRIKSLMVSIPCVTGPYTSVNCILSMTGNWIRMSEDVAAGYGDPFAGADPRFVQNVVAASTIATSHGQNDAGVFELTYDRSDAQFNPFENAGAISQWTIALPRENNQFDTATTTDVILHVRYTAVQGGLALTNAAKANLDAVLPTSGFRLLVLKQEFGSEWYRFFNPNANQDQVFAITIKPEHLPFNVRARAVNKTIRIAKVDLVVESAHGQDFTVHVQVPGAPAPADEAMAKDPVFGNMHHLEKNIAAVPVRNLLGDWKIKIKKAAAGDFRSLQPEDIAHAYLVAKYVIQ